VEVWPAARPEPKPAAAPAVPMPVTELRARAGQVPQPAAGVRLEAMSRGLVEQPMRLAASVARAEVEGAREPFAGAQSVESPADVERAPGRLVHLSLLAPSFRHGEH